MAGPPGEPLFPEPPEERFLTWEPDLAGFNNVRVQVRGGSHEGNAHEYQIPCLECRHRLEVVLLCCACDNHACEGAPAIACKSQECELWLYFGLVETSTD